MVFLVRKGENTLNCFYSSVHCSKSQVLRYIHSDFWRQFQTCHRRTHNISQRFRCVISWPLKYDTQTFTDKFCIFELKNQYSKKNTRSLTTLSAKSAACISILGLSLHGLQLPSTMEQCSTYLNFVRNGRPTWPLTQNNLANLGLEIGDQCTWLPRPIHWPRKR